METKWNVMYARIKTAKCSTAYFSSEFSYNAQDYNRMWLAEKRFLYFCQCCSIFRIAPLLCVFRFVFLGSAADVLWSDFLMFIVLSALSFQGWLFHAMIWYCIFFCCCCFFLSRIGRSFYCTNMTSFANLLFVLNSDNPKKLCTQKTIDFKWTCLLTLKSFSDCSFVILPMPKINTHRQYRKIRKITENRITHPWGCNNKKSTKKMARKTMKPCSYFFLSFVICLCFVFFSVENVQFACTE